jgi:hypothetical protein
VLRSPSFSKKAAVPAKVLHDFQYSFERREQRIFLQWLCRHPSILIPLFEIEVPEPTLPGVRFALLSLNKVSLGKPFVPASHTRVKVTGEQHFVSLFNFHQE